ncbi:MAG: PorP/SprF family type IX secretion system membrane protein [Vicingus serpentipes]|nr:PorP/SprF family type IX secretion system membrane protein [Vicingus serpentipes]
MKKILYLLIGVLLVLDLSGQDIHFSQYYNTPMMYNPALTGVFGGAQRAMLAYRNQWMTVASPYTTYGAAFDMRMMEKRGGNFSLGTGLGVYRDVSGDTKMGITNVVLSLSGIIGLSEKQHLMVGFQGGVEQRSMGGEMIWDNQYDKDAPDYYNVEAPTGEISSYNTGFVGMDLNVGLAWVYSESVKRIVNQDNFSLKLGAVYQHVGSQTLKYGDTPDDLYGKLSFHGESNISVPNSNTSFQPNLIYQRQGPNQEILLGSLIRYKLGFDSQYTGMLQSSAVYIGLHARYGDALIPSVGYEVSNWKIMFSYDSNLSGLRTASNSIGGFEVTLTFINPGSMKSGRGSARFN